MSDTPVIRLQKISKSFGEVRANQDISLDIHEGRILALLGENGAGKSTLMSLLAGQSQPDSGTIYFHGTPVSFSSTEKAIEAGIGMVYQHFKLVEAMTVAENIFLGRSDRFAMTSMPLSAGSAGSPATGPSTFGITDSCSITLPCRPSATR